MERAFRRGYLQMTEYEATVRTMERLRHVRRELVGEYPFFGELLMNLSLAVAEVETACTDGKYRIVDPAFSMRLSLFQNKRKKSFIVEHCL